MCFTNKQRMSAKYNQKKILLVKGIFYNLNK